MMTESVSRKEFDRLYKYCTYVGHIRPPDVSVPASYFLATNKWSTLSKAYYIVFCHYCDHFFKSHELVFFFFCNTHTKR